MYYDAWKGVRSFQSATVLTCQKSYPSCVQHENAGELVKFALNRTLGNGKEGSFFHLGLPLKMGDMSGCLSADIISYCFCCWLDRLFGISGLNCKTEVKKQQPHKHFFRYGILAQGISYYPKRMVWHGQSGVRRERGGGRWGRGKRRRCYSCFSCWWCSSILW